MLFCSVPVGSQLVLFGQLSVADMENIAPRLVRTKFHFSNNFHCLQQLGPLQVAAMEKQARVFQPEVLDGLGIFPRCLYWNRLTVFQGPVTTAPLL